MVLQVKNTDRSGVFSRTHSPVSYSPTEAQEEQVDKFQVTTNAEVKIENTSKSVIVAVTNSLRSFVLLRLNVISARKQPPASDIGIQA